MCGVAYLAYIVACRVADPLVRKLRDQVMMAEAINIWLDMLRHHDRLIHEIQEMLQFLYIYIHTGYTCVYIYIILFILKTVNHDVSEECFFIGTMYQERPPLTVSASEVLLIVVPWILYPLLGRYKFARVFDSESLQEDLPSCGTSFLNISYTSSMRLRLRASSYSFTYNPERSVAVWLKLMERVVAGCAGMEGKECCPWKCWAFCVECFLQHGRTRPIRRLAKCSHTGDASVPECWQAMSESYELIQLPQLGCVHEPSQGSQPMWCASECLSPWRMAFCGLGLLGHKCGLSKAVWLDWFKGNFTGNHRFSH